MNEGGELSAMPVRDRSAFSRGGAIALGEKFVSVLRQPLRSLPSRIILSVFSAALVTSLAVAWISTQSIQSFLRREIDEKFPAILRGATERLELWYAQRQLDVETFASSPVVIENLGRLQGATSRRSKARAREELGKYLSYVLERFPQYQALFLLDAEGESLLWAGARFDLPRGFRERLAGVSGPQVGEIHRLGPRSFQLASSPVRDTGERAVASLHAVVGIEALEGILRNEELGEAGGIFVVGRDGKYLTQGTGTVRHARFPRPLPAPGAAPVVAEYENGEGEHVVGSAVRFSRFGWTIAVEEAYEAAFAPVVTVIREILGINLGIVAIFGAIAYQIARSIVRPIRALSAGARRIAEGETDVVIPSPAREDEIGVLTRAFNEMSSRLAAQYDQLQRANEVLEQLSITDGLTKLHNHRFFQEHLPQEMKRAARTGEPLALMLIDIDDFKKLNDSHGHAVGDAILRRVAERMNEAVREMDLLARYGGEEFALLASRTDRAGAVALAEKIRIAVSRRSFSVVDLDGPDQVPVTVSIGVAAFRGDEKALFNDADRALYRAKAAGKDCVVAADDD